MLSRHTHHRRPTVRETLSFSPQKRARLLLLQSIGSRSRNVFRKNRDSSAGDAYGSSFGKFGFTRQEDRAEPSGQVQQEPGAEEGRL